MKRVFLILFLLPLLCSCGVEKQIPLFEDHPMTIVGDLSCNGEVYAVRIELISRDAAKIAIEAPENLSGYSFKVDNSSIWVYYDNMQTELQADSNSIPFFYIFKALTVSRENFEYSRKDNKAVIYHYSMDGADTMIYTDISDHTPFCIEYRKESVCVKLDIKSGESVHPNCALKLK